MTIDITGVDLRKFVQEVYDMSIPVGLGFLHARPGGLSDADADAIINREEPNGRIAVSMDYVHGRQCKMTVFRSDDGRLTIDNNWFDHTEPQFDELLKRCGINHAYPVVAHRS